MEELAFEAGMAQWANMVSDGLPAWRYSSSMVPCRLESFNFDECCVPAYGSGFPTGRMEACFAGAERQQVARFAHRFCCDDRAAALAAQRVMAAVYRGAGCFEDCASVQARDAGGPDVLTCGCERSLLQELLESSMLPESAKQRWLSWLGASWGGKDWRHNLKFAAASRQPREAPGGWDGTAQLLRALSLLEGVLAFPGLPREPPEGEGYSNVVDRDWAAEELRELLSLRLAKYQAQAAARYLELQPSLGGAGRRPGAGAEPEPVVHVAMVASVGEPVFGQKALATLRSCLAFARKRRVHLHLFADGPGEADLRRALSEDLEPHLRSRAAAIDFHGPEALQRAGAVIHRYVPQSCIDARGMAGWQGVYGAPGWMRIFPHEVMPGDIQDLIWADAGDYIFLADPADLLEAHLKAVRGQVDADALWRPARRDFQAMASFPEGNPLPLQVFSLATMRSQPGRWTNAAKSLLRRLWAKGNGTRGWLCYRGEGSLMVRMTQEHPELFVAFAGEWAHEPRIAEFTGLGIKSYYRFGHNDRIWEERQHPGLLNPTAAFVYCPGFTEVLLHSLFVVVGTFPTFAVELEQALRSANETVHHRAQWDAGREEAEYAGYQRIRCGRPVLGMHLIRNFHTVVPWSVRLLDFWSARPGLWGRKADQQKRWLPSSLDP